MPMQMVLTGRPQVLHRVVDGEAGRDHAAGRVDVQADVALRVLRLEEQQLRDDQVRDVVLDGVAEEDDALAEQPAVDVVGALAPARGLDDHRHEHRPCLERGLQRRGRVPRRLEGGQLAGDLGPGHASTSSSLSVMAARPPTPTAASSASSACSASSVSSSSSASVAASTWLVDATG